MASTQTEARSPFDAALKRGLGKLKSLGLPSKAVETIEDGFHCAQEHAQELVSGLKDFSAAGFLRSSATESFLLDRLDGRTFKATRKGATVDCTLKHEGTAVKLYVPDGSSTPLCVGQIDIGAIGRFDATAKGIKVGLDASMLNQKTLLALNNLWAGDRHFGRLAWMDVYLDAAFKKPLEEFVTARYLKVFPDKQLDLMSRRVTIGGVEAIEYYGCIPRNVSMEASMLSHACKEMPNLAKLVSVLSGFAEKANYAAATISGKAATNGWWVFSPFHQPGTMDGWGCDPLYHQPVCKVSGLRLSKKP